MSAAQNNVPRNRLHTPSANRAAADQCDILAIGLNATDTLIRVPRFPAFDSKTKILSSALLPGGQAATAAVACQRWGLRARYSGKVGDDAAGKFQQKEMEREGVEAHWVVAPGCSSQIAYILVDKISGERTVLKSPP